MARLQTYGNVLSPQMKDKIAKSPYERTYGNDNITYQAHAENTHLLGQVQQITPKI